MKEHLFGGVNVDPKRVHVPNGMVQEVDAHCVAYEAAIAAAGGIDLQLLGIGSDGHIAYNSFKYFVQHDAQLVGLWQAQKQKQSTLK